MKGGGWPAGAVVALVTYVFDRPSGATAFGGTGAQRPFAYAAAGSSAGPQAV